MSPVLAYFFSQTYTAVDLHRRLGVLQECLEAVLYDEPEQMRVMPVAERRQKAIKQLVADETDRQMLTDMDDELWDSFTPATLVTKLNQLEAEAAALPVMTLYVPVAFGTKELQPIAEWVRGAVDRGLLLEVEVDPQVVGGCAFVYNDTHFDWSLRRYLRARKGMVTSLLNTYGA